MKTKTLTALLVLLGTTMFSTFASASDADSTAVEKKIVKIVTIDDNGTYVVDSVFSTVDGKTTVRIDSMMYPGDMGHREMRMRHIDPGFGFFWKGDPDDMFGKDMEAEIDSMQAMMMGRMRDFDFGNMPNHWQMQHCAPPRMRNNSEDEDMPMLPTPPIHVKHSMNKTGMIDLNDPSIIRYEKQLQKDGTEKITIIRKTE